MLIKVICCQFLTKVHILKFRCNTLFYGILSGLFRNSGEGDFHILHYVQYGLDGVDKYHLRADHAYRSAVNSSVFIVLSTELKLSSFSLLEVLLLTIVCQRSRIRCDYNIVV